MVNEKVRGIQTSYRALSGNYQTIANDIQGIQDRITSYTKIASEAEAICDEAGQKIDELQSNISSLQADKKTLEKELDRRRRESEEEREALSSKIEAIGSEITQLQAQLREETRIYEENMSSAQQYRERVVNETNVLEYYCNHCDSFALELERHTLVLERIAPTVKEQRVGFQKTGAAGYARASAASAKQIKNNDFHNITALAGQTRRLAQCFRSLARNNMPPDSASSGDSATSTGTGQASKSHSRPSVSPEKIVGVAAALSMIGGAGFAATRPDETFITSDGEQMSQIEIVGERIKNVDEALTGPDDLVKDLEWVRERREWLEASRSNLTSVAGSPFPPE